MPREGIQPLPNRSSEDRLQDSDNDCSNKGSAVKLQSHSQAQKVNKLRRMFSSTGQVQEKKTRKPRGKIVQSDPNSRSKKNNQRRRNSPEEVSPEKKSLDRGSPDSRIVSGEIVSAEQISKVSQLTGTKKEPVDEIPLQEGDCIGSETKKYLVKRKLGAGGYGAVYHVILENEDNKRTHYALKAELRAPGTSNRLKMEVEVLRSIKKADKSLQTHFALMADTGRVHEFAFVVLTLCGPSISMIRERVLTTDFSHGTAIRIGMESLAAIRDLHTVGYIHRDIKPSNLTIGLGPLFTTIFLIDFGIARRCLNAKGHLRLPRPKAKFCGTPRYASRASHRNEDQSRNSDLESWFYMLMDLYNQNSLPWKRIRERDLILALKEDIRMNECRSRCIVELMPSEYRLIMMYIDSLKYENKPDYAYILTLLGATLKRMGLTLTETYDWEKFGPPPSDND